MTTPPAWYPRAIRKNIKPGSNDGPITPALAILHVAVTNVLSLFLFFRDRSGGIESHFYIRKDGTVEQYRNVLRQADANLGANSYTVAGVTWGAVSIETAGFALGWWNKAQKAAIKELLLWLHVEHGIPLKTVKVPRPTLAEGGVSYHSRHREWSPVAKSCPGPNRIKQYLNVFIPWMLAQGREFAAYEHGDTLTDFAQRHDLSVARLWRLNRPVPSVGDQLRVK